MVAAVATAAVSSTTAAVGAARQSLPRRETLTEIPTVKGTREETKVALTATPHLLVVAACHVLTAEVLTNVPASLPFTADRVVGTIPEVATLTGVREGISVVASTAIAPPPRRP